MNKQEEAFYIWEKNQHLSPEECWHIAEEKTKNTYFGKCANIVCDNYIINKSTKQIDKKYIQQEEKEQPEGKFINLSDRLMQRVKSIYKNIFNKF